jgi:flagellin-like hook-associated protein FlgL
MRITQRAVAQTSLQGLNRNLEAVGKLQQQLTSGRLISTPSDSPIGTNRAMQTRSDQAALDQYARNVSDADTWLQQSDSTIRDMLDTARRVQVLTVQGANTGAMDDVSRYAISVEVASLRESLLGQANTVVQGRPLFGGVTSGPKAYDSTTGAWLGRDGAPVMRRVSDTDSVRVDITGPEAFGPAGADLFTVVNQIAQDLLTNPADLNTRIGELATVMDTMKAAVAEVGSRSARIERETQIISDRSLTLGSQLAEIEDIDLPNTIMRLQMQQVGYEAALSATAKAISPTLLDYLR